MSNGCTALLGDSRATEFAADWGDAMSWVVTIQCLGGGRLEIIDLQVQSNKRKLI